jgi:hypothetical protein
MAAVLLSALLFAGCSNPIQDTAEQSESGASTGTVLLSLASQTSRTLVPSFTDLSYTISFAGASAVDSVTDWNGTNTKTVSLLPGTWTITVAGYNGQTKVSEGSVADVVISAGATTAKEVTVTPVFGSGDGSFSYSTGWRGISFPENVETAVLTLSPLDTGGTAELSRDLKTTASDTISLKAGLYLLTVKLTKSDGTQAIKSEIVHIYTGETTDTGTDLSFTNDNFAMVELAAFSSVSAVNDNAAGIITLTLSFDKAITGLSKDDITIGGFTGVQKETFAAGAETGKYTLTLTGLTTDGNITVSAAKPGYEINPSAQSVSLSLFTFPGTVSITGSAIRGETLTANIDDLGVSETGITYQWNRDDRVIYGAASETYTLGYEDVGETITVTISKTGYASKISDPTALVVNPALTGTVTISGTTRVGQTLTATISDDCNGTGTPSYQWVRGESTFIGDNLNTYIPGTEELGSTIRVKVTYTWFSGEISSRSTETIAPALGDGGIVIGARPEIALSIPSYAPNSLLTITATTGFDSYQWVLDGRQQNETANTLRVNTALLATGSHSVSVIAAKGGVYYSATGTFTTPLPVPTGATELPYNQYYSSSISGSSGHFYYFYANAGERFTVVWYDRDNNSSSYPADIKVGAKMDGSSSYLVSVGDYSSTNRITFTVTTAGYVLVEVQLLNSSSSTGAYAVGYYKQ